MGCTSKNVNRSLVYFTNTFCLHAALKVMCTKRFCRHVNKMRLKLEEPNICNVEIVKWMKKRQHSLTSPRSNYMFWLAGRKGHNNTPDRTV